jgi:hypothetical protein
MMGNVPTPGWLKQRARNFFLSGSYWFGAVALLLQLAAYGGYGTAKLTHDVRKTVSYLWEWLHGSPEIWAWYGGKREAPLMFVLKNADWGLPEQLIFGAVGLAALGAVLALVTFTLQWRRPIPSALALLLNVAPALLSVGLIYQSGK